jgi:thiamine-phosphate pyrophosphorylase
LEVARCAISGGIDILQMREKKASKEELAKLGRELASLCNENGVIFIVNDDPILARQVNADGVHLGQEDLQEYPIGLTRAIMGKDKMIGISTHSIDQFKRANESGCDYIAFGPIFSTPTKEYSIGTEDIKKSIRIAKKPVVFIGGIDMDNIDAVLEEGARNIAVIRAIVQAKDVTRAVKELKERINSCV